VFTKEEGCLRLSLKDGTRVRLYLNKDDESQLSFHVDKVSFYIYIQKEELAALSLMLGSVEVENA